MNDSGSEEKNRPPRDPERRKFLRTASSIAMVGGLAAGYGTFAAYAGRFIYPAKGQDKAWLFVTQVRGMNRGDSIEFRTPAGAPVTVTRQGNRGKVDDFLALSSTCPHLGCQVHWEAHNNRFFCPCHNGIFDPSGKGIGGPPGDAGQSLPRYPLKIDKGLLYIEVPTGYVASTDRAEDRIDVARGGGPRDGREC